MSLPYPPTRAEPLIEERFGQSVADPFRWLEREDDPEVKDWMKAEDGLTRTELSKLEARESLARRFTQLFYVESISPPAKRGARLFYGRTHRNREKAILYWRDADGPETVLLDPNSWGDADHPVSLGVWAPSWDGRYLAFARHPNAADDADLHVLEVATGQWSECDVIPGCKYAYPSWAPDGSGFYYAWLPSDPAIPSAERPGYTEMRYHHLGSDPAHDEIIHPRTGDPQAFLNGGISRDGRLLFVSIQRGWNENDVYFRRAGERAFTLLAAGRDAHYEVQTWRDELFILTDEGALRRRILKTTAAAPPRTAWREIVPEDPSASLEGFLIAGGHLILKYLKNASTELRVATLDGTGVRRLELPSIGSVSALSGLEDDDELFVQFSSFTVPRQIYRTSVATGKMDLWSKVELPIDPSGCTVEQVWYPSKDGTRVSMFLIHRNDYERNGAHPTWLYGYGGFEVSLTPDFRASVYPWLEAGGLYAIPNLRGGAEYGKAWHDGGKLLNKQNVFDDFIGAAEYLIREGHTRPGRVVINGGSNGGLLVGAAMTQRPELFGAVVCQVPLLDMLRYVVSGGGRTWVPEYGDPSVREHFLNLLSYSPYHQVKPAVAYPPLLMLSADHDDRVDPMHARKFVAAIQAASSGGPALLRIEHHSGHAGADAVKQAIEMYADMFAFALNAIAPPLAAGSAVPTPSPSGRRTG